MSLEDKLMTQKGKDELKNFVKQKMELLNNWIIIMKRELESSLEYLTKLYEVFSNKIFRKLWRIRPFSLDHAQ